MKTALAFFLLLGLFYGKFPGQACFAVSPDEQSMDNHPREQEATDHSSKNCEPYPVPLNENFDDVDPPSLPLCWIQKINSSSNWASVQTTTALDPFSPPNHVYMSNGADEDAEVILISPAIDAELQDLQLRFYARGSSEGQSLHVGSYNTSTESFILIETFSLASTYAEYVLLFETYTGTDIRIAFKHGLGGTWKSIYIDNFSLAETASCAPPTGLTITDITATSATLGWTAANEDDNLWNIEWGLAGFEQGTGNLANGHETTSYQLSGLASNTNHHFYVQTDCGNSEKELSPWAGPFPFKTAIAIPFFEGFEDNLVHESPVVGWTQQSESGIYNWRSNNLTAGNRAPRTGEWNALLTADNTHWMFVDVDVTAGTTYTFIMYARQDGSNPADATIRVSYGQEGNMAAMTGVIIPETGIVNGLYQEMTGTFTPGSSGRIFVGIRGSINFNPWYIVIDDISITDPSMAVNLSGVVYDTAGQAFEGARVFSGNMSVYTGENGVYMIESIQPGNYSFSVEAGGHATISEELTIVADQDNVHNFSFNYANPDLPFSPWPLSQISMPVDAMYNNAATNGAHLYIPFNNDELHIYDVENPFTPSFAGVSFINDLGKIFYNGYLFAGTGNDISVYSLDTPQMPQLSSVFPAGGTLLDIAFKEGMAYALIHNGTQVEILVLDISDPTALTKLSSIELEGGGESSMHYEAGRHLIYVHGFSFYPNLLQRITLVDVSNDDSPVITYTGNAAATDGRLAGSRNYFVLAENVDDRGRLNAYCTEDPSSPTLIVSQWLPVGSTIREITNVDGTLMLYVFDGELKLHSLVFDETEEAFFMGISILENSSFGGTSFTWFNNNSIDKEVSAFASKEKDDEKEDEENLTNYTLFPTGNLSGSTGDKYVPIGFKKSQLTAVLTVSGMTEAEYICPYDIGLAYAKRNMGTISFCANPLSDWSLSGFSILSYGSGNEIQDVVLVEVEGPAFWVGTYDADNGYLNVIFDNEVLVPADECVTFDLFYTFYINPVYYASDVIRTFLWETANIIAEPVDFPRSTITGKAYRQELAVAKVINTKGYLFPNIQAAIDDPTTEDGEEVIAICAGEYPEPAINIHKNLHVKSLYGSEQTFLIGSGTMLSRLVEIVQPSISLVTVEGFSFGKPGTGDQNYPSYLMGVAVNKQNMLSDNDQIAIINNIFSEVIPRAVSASHTGGEFIVANNEFRAKPSRGTRIVSIGLTNEYNTHLTCDNNLFTSQNNLTRTKSHRDNRHIDITLSNKSYGKDWVNDVTIEITNNKYATANFSVFLKTSFLYGDDKTPPVSFAGDLLIKNNHILNSNNLGNISGRLDIIGSFNKAHIENNQIRFNDIQNVNELIIQQHMPFQIIEGESQIIWPYFIVDNFKLLTVNNNYLELLHLSSDNRLYVPVYEEFILNKNPASIVFDNNIVRATYYNLRPTKNKHVFRGNILNISHSSAVDIEAASGIELTGNFIENAQTGINIGRNTEQISIRENQIKDCDIGIIAENSAYLEISRNVLKDIRAVGIKFLSCNTEDNPGEVFVVNNKLINNCTGITSSYSSIISFGNMITDQYCDNTGICLLQSHLQASNNAITGNMGNGVFADAASTACISGSNILNNDPFGLRSFAPKGSFMANGNFWGTADGPQAGDICGSIEADDWLESPAQLGVAFPGSEKFTPMDEVDSVIVFVQNIWHPDDQVEITATDSKGWLMSKQSRNREFADSTGYSLYLVYETPANEADSSLLTVTVNSLNHPGETASNSITLFSYLPEATRMTIMPDSVAIATTDTLLFDAIIFDQNGRILELDVEWEADAGSFLADQPGVYKAPETAGIVSITATTPTNKLSASAHIRVWEGQIPIEQIIILPDEVYLLPQQVEAFTAFFTDPDGFLLAPDTNAVWTATGGEIDMFGLYVAGLLTGTFEVTLTDTLQQVSASVMVYIVEELPGLAPPEPPELMSPADGSPGLQVPVALNWTNVAGADYYILEVAYDEDFENMLTYISQFETHYLLDVPESLTTYFWRVRAASSAGIGYHSTSWSFTTGDGEAPEVPETLNVSGVVAVDADECFNALQTITVSNFTVEAGGSATLIAGQSIILLPGTHVQSGGYFHAYITMDDTFCGPAAKELDPEEIIVTVPEIPQRIREDLFFKVYPNPTDGTFTLELETVEEGSDILIEVLGLLGGRVLSDRLPPQRMHTLSLSGHQPGVYIIRITQGDKVGVERVIKR